VHAPLAGELVAARYIPGNLFSVNETTVARVNGLFRRNERLVMHFKTAHGPVALIFVGALNVGSISTRWSEELRPLKHGVGDVLDLSQRSTVVIKGELLGWFNMGSTVIVLLPAGTCEWNDDLQPGEALRQALVNLESIAAPAGEVPVVLGPGWPGILLHEAIGHGLEGDFNRKKTSAFAGLMGERVASPSVTVVDDGTMDDRRGSLTIDDEGTPTERTVLIEDGILTGYMQDRMNAHLMGEVSTGNGRRESYAHAPMPRMTNTYMLAGEHEPEEILQSVKKGLYAVSFGGGQVDITSGKFVFTCTEAYLIEDGKKGPPVKGATLIGNGPDVLTRVSMIGNDMALDPGVEIGRASCRERV